MAQMSGRHGGYKHHSPVLVEVHDSGKPEPASAMAWGVSDAIHEPEQLGVYLPWLGVWVLPPSRAAKKKKKKRYFGTYYTAVY